MNALFSINEIGYNFNLKFYLFFRAVKMPRVF